MKLTLKNLKVAEHLSEETTAFTATVYIDGKRAFTARNDGRGGENMLESLKQDRGIIDRAQTHFASLPPETSEYGDLPMSLDFAISLAVDEALHLKDMKRCLKKVTVKTPEGIATFQASIKPTPENLTHIARKYPDYVILNSLSEDDALKLWKEA
tara:strand:- start:6 stop:470 length:465 start_codon:yes stop_codon:yes gene_type:complete